ncbi:hypothetical protein RFI_16989 [Reticulomyxa filosa]|uniref:Uncharacterized protein n=1 Tax=Reticulomyxa filosa TaxID=46433 RepID=X6N2U8_RETFI|nr:hypothetical protein RFI_16989 [Reticulomyxa filosa]|eukprot:ETO20228.1 hypothetical protein RFI_16989 [Reticulomyxa filosa]
MFDLHLLVFPLCTYLYIFVYIFDEMRQPKLTSPLCCSCSLHVIYQRKSLPFATAVENYKVCVDEARAKWPKRAQRYHHDAEVYEEGIFCKPMPKKKERNTLFFCNVYIIKKKKICPQSKEVRRIYFVDMKIKRVSNINTTKEKFRAKFHYYLTWLATKEENYEKDNTHWKPSSVPYIEYINAIEIKKHKQISYPKKKKRGKKKFYQVKIKNVKF